MTSKQKFKIVLSNSIFIFGIVACSALIIFCIKDRKGINDISKAVVPLILCVIGLIRNSSIKKNLKDEDSLEMQGELMSERFLTDNRGRKLYLKANKYILEKNYIMGIRTFQKALKIAKLNSDKVIVLISIGSAYSDLKKSEKAIAAYMEALKYEYNNDFVLSNLGYEYKEINELDKAAEALKAAVFYNPGNWMAYNNLASSYKKANKYDKALEASEEAVRIKPDNPQTVANHSYYCALAGDFARSEIYFENSVRLGYEHIKNLRESIDYFKNIQDKEIRENFQYESSL